jgi:hypothetical protein
MFYQFCHLCTPLLLPGFPDIITTTGTSAPVLACEGILPLTGAPPDDLASMPVVRSGAPGNVFNYWAYSTSTGSPFAANRCRSCDSGSFMRLSVSPVGLSRMQLTFPATFSRMSALSKQLCAWFLFHRARPAPIPILRNM